MDTYLSTTDLSLAEQVYKKTNKKYIYILVMKYTLKKP